VNINLTVTRVELLPSGAMRWHFLFSNDSKNNTNILLRYSGSTYLSDEYGHHYEMVQDAAGTDPQYIYQMELPTLAKLEHWIQFPAPMNGAKKFTVVLASSGSGYAAEFPTFVVMLP